MEIEKVLQTNYPLPNYKKVLMNILYTNNWILEEVNKVLKPFDISHQQFNVLRILKGQNGQPTNLQTIQERMIAKNSNATRLVDKLQAKGLVSKKVCEANRRKIEIEITHEGLEFLTLVNKVIESCEKKIVAKLSTQDIENLNTQLTKIRLNHDDNE